MVEATAGFGATLVTITLAAQRYGVDEVLARFMPVSLLLSGALLLRNRGSVEVPLLTRRVAPWMGLGFVAGLAALGLHGQTWIKAVFGGFVVVLSAVELRRGAPSAAPMPPGVRAAALVAAGLVHGLFACGGPLLVWVVGRELPDKGTFRATLAAVWLVLGVVLVGTYAAEGRVTGETLTASVALLPALGLGLLGGEWLHRRVPPAPFRRGVYLLLLAAGGSLVLRSL